MKFAILLIIFIHGHFISAGERITIKSIDKMMQFVLEKKAVVGAENILVVYDFDNTLMAMDQDIGSDQWYNWQAELIKNKKAKYAVAKTKGELFVIHSKISALGKMHLVEMQIPKVVKDIQQLKIKSIILTSRGSNLRNDLEDELARVELEFKSSAIGPSGGYASTFLPEEIENPREISFMDGIVMGSGQHKGKILKSILKKTGEKFKLIVFLDDTIKNIENMESEFNDEVGDKVELYTFYYTHELERVLKFNLDKSKAHREWKKLKPALQSVFGEI